MQLLLHFLSVVVVPRASVQLTKNCTRENLKDVVIFPSPLGRGKI